MGSLYDSENLTVSGDSIEQDLTLASSTSFRRVDFNLIKEELIIYLRNNISDPQERGNVKTDVFTGNGSTVKFQLTESSAKNIQYVKSGDSILSRYSQYYVDYKDKDTLTNPVIYLLTPPSSGALVEIKYTYSTSSWIYSDFPRVSLTVDNYPRIRVNILSMITEEFGLHADYNLSDMVVEVIVWAAGSNQLDQIVKDIRDSFIRNKKGFYFFNLIVPSTVSPMLSTPERGDKILQRNCDYMIKFKPEEV